MQTNFDTVMTLKGRPLMNNTTKTKQNKNTWNKETLASTEVRKYRQKKICIL